MYIIKGVYTGKTAVSILFWAIGTILLTSTTIFGLIFLSNDYNNFEQWILRGLLGSCLCFIVSCMYQYGVFFSGPAGISLPFGIVLMIMWIILLRCYFNFPNKNK
jgi:hypothetical protein